MVVVDAGALIAIVDDAEPRHMAVTDVVASERGPFLLSPLVLAEADYLLLTRRGLDQELALLRDVVSGVYHLEPFTRDDVGVATSIIERYRALRIGLADASNVVLARRHNTTRLLTLDERHFRAIEPLQGGSFTILPADA